MVPKIIHLCWFSEDSYPVEIKICLESWKRVLPDFKIRRWTYADAKSIGCPFIDEALEARKWAFASDVVRFYALYKEGGVYMDSDMLVERRFDSFIPEKGFATFQERIKHDVELQAAFLIGEPGNSYCREVYEYYNRRHFRLPDGSLDMKISPVIMVEIAEKRGYKREDREQHLNDMVVYPGCYVSPCKSITYPEAFAHHQVYGSWRKHRLGRRIERYLKHLWLVARFALLRR